MSEQSKEWLRKELAAGPLQGGPSAPAPVHKLIARCEKCAGTREAHYPADHFPRALIVQLAELLDGSSTYYTQPTSPDSPFGRCTKCGGQFRARVL